MRQDCNAKAPFDVELHVTAFLGRLARFTYRYKSKYNYVFLQFDSPYFLYRKSLFYFLSALADVVNQMGKMHYIYSMATY